MTINRRLTVLVLSGLVLVVAGAGYYFGYLKKSQQDTATTTSIPGVETTLCAEFADTYEHNSKDVNHVHIGNLYAVNLQGNHLHTTKDYLDWLKANLSAYAPPEESEKYQNVSSARVAGMMYSMYRWCRASPMNPFVSVIPAVINNQPAPDPDAMYRDDPEGE